MRLLIALIVALVTIFGSLFGLRRCEGSQMPPTTSSAPLTSVVREPAAVALLIDREGDRLFVPIN